MQFRDLKAQYTALKDEIDASIAEVIESTHFISGKQVNELEEKLAEYAGVKHCITCGNGTDALTLMMMAWGIKEGDAVFVPDFTFFASGEVVSYAGATPVFYDVHADTFNADAESLEEAVRAVKAEGKLNPKAIIAVDLFGQPADYENLQKVADKYDLLLLEDGAQDSAEELEIKRPAVLVMRLPHRFFPAKPLGCYGDGGAVFVNDDNIADYLRSVRIHGKGSFKYDNIRIGVNSRLDTIQAALLLPKFKAFCDYELEDVNKVADLYTAQLRDNVITPVVAEGFYSSWAQYTIQLKSRKERDILQNALKEKDIPTMIYYPKPMHRQKAFDGIKQYVDCPVTERLCETVLALPMHPYLSEEQIEFVTENIKYILQEDR